MAAAAGVIGHLLRRTLGSVAVLLTATLLCYLLVVHSGDPLADLRLIADPEQRQARQAERIAALDLETPPLLRYLRWLGGVGGCLLPGLECTLGTDRAGRPVTLLLSQALSSTLSLVVTAAVLALLVGVATGVVAALRAGSLLDHGLGLVAVVCYAAPPFLGAVLVKELGAIDVNVWLADPVVPVVVALAVGVANGLLWAALLGGGRRRRGLVFAVAAVTGAIVVGQLGAVRWFADPALGPGAVGLGAFVVGALGLTLAGRARFGPLLGAAGVAVSAAILLVLTGGWLAAADGWARPLTLAVALAAVGAVLGLAVGGRSRWPVAGALAVTGAAGAVLIGLDHVLREVPGYRQARGGTLIPTFGAGTPGGVDGFWAGILDQQLHLLLPSLTLCLFSLATYLRFTRAGLLQALAGDHVLAARSWGLSERQVVVGHALRNALPPVVTLAALEAAAVIAGAVVIEDVFGWEGMGALFETGLHNTDPAPVMAFVLVSGLALVIANVLADLVHAVLDPRVLR